MPICCCIHEFLRFWKISRNCLAGDEPPLGDSSILRGFWAARRRVGFLTVSGFWDEGPGGVDPAARRHKR